MRKRRLPLEIVRYTERLLTDRKTKLWFNDYESKWFTIKNGIGQGNPLLMIHNNSHLTNIATLLSLTVLYVIYSSDLVDAAKGKKELTLAFVDDMALIAIGKTFDETH
ncbi:hypothetical protein BKA82DRAFT_106179, partial [Pisolithus tinctorius]